MVHQLIEERFRTRESFKNSLKPILPWSLLFFFFINNGGGIIIFKIVRFHMVIINSSLIELGLAFITSSYLKRNERLLKLRLAVMLAELGDANIFFAHLARNCIFFLHHDWPLLLLLLLNLFVNRRAFKFRIILLSNLLRLSIYIWRRVRLRVLYYLSIAILDLILNLIAGKR